MTTRPVAKRRGAVRQTWPVQVPCPIAPRDQIPREGSPHFDVSAFLKFGGSSAKSLHALAVAASVVCCRHGSCFEAWFA